MGYMFAFVPYPRKILLTPPYFINIKLDILLLCQIEQIVRTYFFYICIKWRPLKIWNPLHKNRTHFAETFFFLKLLLMWLSIPNFPNIQHLFLKDLSLHLLYFLSLLCSTPPPKFTKKRKNTSSPSLC